MRTAGRNTNVSDESDVSDFVEITVDVAVKVSDENPSRIYWAITVMTKDAFIRFIPAATDGAVRKGILLKKDQTYEMSTDNIYIGEISIINKKNGDKPEYSITTF